MPAVDTFSQYTGGTGSSAPNAAAVTPDDDTDLDYVTRLLWVGGAGAVTVTMQYGGNVTFSGVPAGTLLPIRVSRVLAAGTDATLIVALW